MSIVTGKPPGQCPELATQSVIITKQNVKALKLSTYNRTHGTTVTISCLAAPDYRLVGPSVLTCLNTNQWDKTVPYCTRADPTSRGPFDISMVPILVAAGSIGVVLLAVVCVMTYVNCCWKQSKSKGHSHRVEGGPIGLFRSLGLQDAESTFNYRRHRFYEASECSDVMDSVSARYPPHTLTPEMGPRRLFIDTASRSSPNTYITAISRGTEQPYRTRLGPGQSYPHGDTQPRLILDGSSPTPYNTAQREGTEPPLKIQVGTGQPYRTWHELFYDSFT